MAGARDDVPWLDAEEQAAWRAYMEMRDEVTLRLERDLQARSGLSGADYQVLVHLSESPGDAVRPVEVCTALRWEQSRLSHQLTRMERRGLVERRACEEDGRGSIVALTDEGRAAIEEAAPGHVVALRALLVDVIGRDGMLQLGAIARRVLDALPDDDLRPRGGRRAGDRSG
ncbi:MarR family winged helix-turn-helix transcriptional regulator [Dermatobacter hominis]|uniref:MarR family winged helix-turn-helix transcriptional regulator n=1 Tax=Dermatobacter hominis TaxID=2884263 RepID=UPI001D11AF83|nr:MarR family transcriptional regulator [Dermatobacter hominis]UDY36779.1 MarR family transcriptional regulator [Dermatobacter hominis]